MRDRISDLPDHLLDHILSFLPTRDQVRTGILSKLWKTIWISSPVLQFYTNMPPWELRLMNFVEDTLGIRHRQMIPISKLVIYLPRFPTLELGSLLCQSISYALESNIKQLELCNDRNGIYDNACNYYDLPDSVLNAKSLSVLILMGFKLKPLPCSSNIKLALKRLHLQNVCLNDQLVRTLLDRCPDLENLSLKSCRGLKNLKISGLFKLKHLSLIFKHISLISYRKRVAKTVQYTPFETIEIEAFRLESFHYCGEPILQYSFSCKNVKKLKLSCVKCKTENWLLDTLSNFPLLEVLHLENCTLNSVKISCHLLKDLCLKDCKNVFKIEIDTPHLHSFTLKNGDLPISFSSNAFSLIEANIHSNSEDQSVKVAEFLGKFNHCKVVNLHCHYKKGLIIPKVSRAVLLPPLYNIKHLTLSTCNYRDLLELVEYLLWTCPRPEILSIICCGQIILSMKFFYENQVEKEETTCFCASLPIICWRHCLKELNIEKLEQIEYLQSVKNFFVENAKILEKIGGLSAICENAKMEKLEWTEAERNLKNILVENAKILDKFNGLTDCNLY